MPDISSIGHGSVGPVNRPTGPASSLPRPETKEATETTETTARPGDRVELSEYAHLLDQLRHLPEIRQELVRTIRQAITQGTYETPQKLGEAIERLFAEMGA